ncbi:MAG TPA: hypothetical protein VFW40_09400, partial [Capsulimonadaceae bacterium]|nr:hypothetical protein [Capsulimonadaceae bacterium]
GNGESLIRFALRNFGELLWQIETPMPLEVLDRFAIIIRDREPGSCRNRVLIQRGLLKTESLAVLILANPATQ